LRRAGARRGRRFSSASSAFCRAALAAAISCSRFSRVSWNCSGSRLAAELGPQELPDHQLQPLALGILERALEVITLALQAIPLVVQSIECSLLPLNDIFHLDQLCQKLIWIERSKSKIYGHAAIILASCRQIHIIPLSRRPSDAAPAAPAGAPRADRRAGRTAAAPTAGPHHRSPAAMRNDQPPAASLSEPDPSRRRRAA